MNVQATDGSACRDGIARRNRALEFCGDPGRPDKTISKEPYLSPEWARLEAERMWPKVWQIVCRLEELPNVGDFHEHTIVHDSIVVVRAAPDKLNAFFNVCQHRARRLVEGSGNTKQLFCKNHGWRWNLDGECTRIVDESDWACLRQEDVPLPQVKVDTWGGWVFVNLDPDAEPLLDYLAPIPEYIDPFEFDKMRMTWHKSVSVNCNWKTMLDAFVEQYHVPTVHHESAPFTDVYAVSFRHGKHSHFGPTPDTRAPGVRPPLTDEESAAERDPRAAVSELMALVGDGLQALWSPRYFEEAEKLKDLPEGMSHAEVYGTLMTRVMERAANEGTGGATITFEQMAKAGGLWHMFPNHSFLMTNDGAIAYRMRPNGDDPHSMVVDIWGLAHLPSGQEPAVTHEHYDRWETSAAPWMLKQDYSNVEEVHKGMRSRGLSRARVNPVQESNISNYHETLRHYLFGEELE
jgi:phenylpropionate dioxygenase-like ring-hydroxylating dioxygenase large terminal subunit